MTKPMWMVRAGKDAFLIDDFLEKKHVAMGIARDLDQVDKDISRKDLIARLRDAHPDWKNGKIAMAAGQFVRFAGEFKVGDEIATYDPSQRRSYLGNLEGEVEAYDSIDVERWYRRRVNWTHRVKRDVLAQASLNNLGSILTLFRVSDDASADLKKHAVAINAPEEVGTQPVAAAHKAPEVTPELRAESMAGRSAELIEDRIASLGWEEMQELVAGILRAMGYKTRISPRGPDRGVDILASPDGLGLQEPRIFVEVKHRPTATMGAIEVRSFMGGMRAGARCLYVSTGGFTKDAKYEAERAAVPLTLIDLTDLRRLLIDNYDNLDELTRRLVPLTKVFWPEDVDA